MSLPATEENWNDRQRRKQAEEDARSQKLDAIISGVEGLLTGRLMFCVSHEQSDRGPEFTPKACYRVVENPDYDPN